MERSSENLGVDVPHCGSLISPPWFDAMTLGFVTLDRISPYLIRSAWLGGGIIPIIALMVWRRRLGALKAASWLVAYGALVLLWEHAGWKISYTLGAVPQEGFVVPAHARIHAFMAAVYASIGMTGLVTTAGIMLRKGSRHAWVILLVAFIIGGSVEVIMDGPAGLLFQHTSPPNPIPGANLLWTYLLAWAAALLISYPAVFVGGRAGTRQDTRNSPWILSALTRRKSLSPSAPPALTGKQPRIAAPR